MNASPVAVVKQGKCGKAVVGNYSERSCYVMFSVMLL